MAKQSDQILKLHRQGVSRANIAEMLGVTEWRVRTAVRSDITQRLQARERVGKTKRQLRLAKVERSKAPTKRAAILSDIHIPYHDHKALAVALAFLEDYKPDTIVLNGDIADFYGASAYRQDPTRMITLQDEINETIAFLEHVRDSHPTADIYYTQGNHEHRLERYILDKAAHLYSLDNLALDSIFQLERLRITWVNHHSVVPLGPLEVTHGTMVRSRSGYSAHAHMQKTGGSVLTGHTHRVSQVCMTNRFGTHISIENGHLASTNVDYAWRPDWQQGFTTIEYSANRFYPRSHIIMNGELVVDGKRYQS